MKTSLLRGLCLAASISSALAQDTTNNTGYFETIIQGLHGADLTLLANALGSINGTEVWAIIEEKLPTGNWTIFAPNNQAFSSAGDMNDTNYLANILSYHIVSGNFTNATASNVTIDSAVYPETTVGRTLFNDSSLVQLEGNRSQVLVWSKWDGVVQALNQDSNITVSNATILSNLLIVTIDGILTPPANLTGILADKTTNDNLNLTSFSGVLTATSTLLSNGTNVTLAAAIDGPDVRGITIFAPNDAALEAEGSSLTSLANNETLLSTVVRNHVINGTSVYSPSFFGSNPANYTSAAGEILTFNTNSSGTFVETTSGGKTVASAKIVRSDVPFKNGVLHVINKVLVNLESNEAAASSAYEAATSSAGYQTSVENGAVGLPTSTNADGSSGDSENAAGSLIAQLVERNGVFATVALAIVGWVVVGAYMV